MEQVARWRGKLPSMLSHEVWCASFSLSEENVGHLLAVLPSLLHLDRASDTQDETTPATNKTKEVASSPFPLFLTATCDGGTNTGA